MRVLVTGATGFVGGHLVKRLLKERHEVHVLVRPTTDLALFGDDLDRIVSHRHHGTTEGMVELVRNVQPDTVMHLASLFLGEHQPGDVDDLIASNVLLSTQLAEAMAANEVQLLINVGTSWQHHEDGGTCYGKPLRSYKAGVSIDTPLLHRNSAITSKLPISRSST
jgi:nucleoside-diphosphate-sugar epimerase